MRITSGRWFRIAARRQFHTVADDVVLEGGDAEDLVGIRRVEGEELVEIIIGHRERVVRELDLLLVLVPFIHRKVGDPAEGEFAVGDEIELLGDARTRLAGQRHGFRLFTGGEEHGVAGGDSRLGCYQLLHFGRNELGDRPLADEIATVILEDDIAQPRRAPRRAPSH